MNAPNQRALVTLESLQDFSVAGVGANDGGPLFPRFQDLVVVFLAFDEFTRIIGAKLAVTWARSPLDGTTEKSASPNVQQCVRPIGAELQLPLPIKHRIGGSEINVLGNIAQTECENQGFVGRFLRANVSVFGT